MATNKSSASVHKAKIKTPATAVLWAYRSPPTADNQETVLGCITEGFSAVGTELDRDTIIVWGAFTKAQVRRIGRSIEQCLDENGFACPPLAGSFDVLREEGRTMLVSDLVQALVELSQ